MTSKLSREYRFKTEKCDAKIRFLRTRYVSNGSTAIVMFIKSDEFSSEDEDVFEMYANLTVNLLNPQNEYLQCIDVNNLGEMTLDWLARKGIATYTDYDVPSGFCIYPLVEFDHNFIDGLEIVQLDDLFVSIPKKTKVNS